MALRVCRCTPDPIPQLRVNRTDLSSAGIVEIDPWRKFVGPTLRSDKWGGPGRARSMRSTLFRLATAISFAELRCINSVTH